jgi:hypothetical protein
MRPVTRHLVAVWNPAYADAMDETIQLLLARAREHGDGKREADDVFVWWGKIKSTNRQKPLEHLKDILAIDGSLGPDDSEEEVHLYLTDYRSLYVGHVGEITADDVRAEDDGGVPSFYTKNNHHCDCWFRLFDIRRLVADDTLGVIEELKKLSNTAYNDRPVSLYGGMVDLPLIVTRQDDAHFFGDDDRASLTDGQYWVEFDAQRSGVGQMERELRDNLLGESTWSALDPAARTFIATAETVFRSHRNDPAFDFSPIVIDLAKAFEVQANAVLRRALSSVAPKDRTCVVDGTSRDVARGHMIPLGQLARLLAEEESLNKRLKASLVNGDWFTAQLPPILKDLSERRNPAAHSSRISAAQASEIRNRLLGIGSQGVIVELAKVRRR